MIPMDILLQFLVLVSLNHQRTFKMTTSSVFRFLRQFLLQLLNKTSRAMLPIIGYGVGKGMKEFFPPIACTSFLTMKASSVCSSKILVRRCELPKVLVTLSHVVRHLAVNRRPITADTLAKHQHLHYPTYELRKLLRGGSWAQPSLPLRSAFHSLIKSKLK